MRPFWSTLVYTTESSGLFNIGGVCLAPRKDWIRDEYGGRALLQGHSNIVFSSGSFDGWSSGAVAIIQADAIIHSSY